MTYDYDRTAARPIPVDKPALAKLAKQLVTELPKHLKFRPDDMDQRLSWCRQFRPNWGFQLGVYETTDVKGGYVGVPVRVKWANMEDWNPTRQWIAGGGVLTRHFERGGVGSKLEMYVKINAARTPNEMLTHLDRIEKEAFSVLIHETTHLRDLLKGVDAYQEAEEGEGKDALYYNSPREVRAFMQQIADEVIEFVEKEAKVLGVGTWGIALNGRTLDRALDMSITWDRVRKSMAPANLKLVIKGVERALRDEWPRLEKLYPAEDINDE